MRGKKAERNRLQTMLSEGIEPRFVDLTSGEYLLEAFVKIGMIKADPISGMSALSFGDIYDFAKATQRISEPWEIEIIASMSNSYIEGVKHGSRNTKREPIDQG